MSTTSTHENGQPTAGLRLAGRSGLDVMLTDAATEHGGASRFLKPTAAGRTLAGLARHPRRAAGHAGSFGAELMRVAAGRSERVPAKGDRRFDDRAWEENWLLHRMLQSYLATCEVVDQLISDADLDWRTERQARFAATNVLDALAPTNFPWSNPAVLKESIDRGGANLVSGARRFVRDMARAPRLPASVDVAKFEVGDNLAVTPGSVVLHTDVFELIHYRPTTGQVRLPLLLVPNQPAVHVNAACSGGIITASAIGHLAATGRQDRIASLTMMVCALDNARAGTTAALTSREVAADAVAESARKGYLDGRALAGVFAWLRPNDLIWNYVVNNYLLGKEPPAFDILYWNQDTVRLAAGLHRDFIRIAIENSLTRPGAVEVLGTPVDLGAIELDSYVIAGLNDHIVPWENAFRSAQLLGGSARFVLSTSGHIQALVNPASPESRASYRLTDDRPPDAEGWVAEADIKRGSWWPDYIAWLGDRSGALQPAPKTLGSRKFKATAKAPGTYVHAS